MADPFNLDLTATQINTALNNAYDSDKAPASGASNLVNSNNIYSFVTSQVDAAVTEAVTDAVNEVGLTKTTGSAPYYACRAWATYNGVTETLGSSGNVASITRVSSGVYDIVFTTAMPDADYAVTTGGSGEGATGSSYISVPRVVNKTVSGFRIDVRGGGPSGSSPDVVELSFAVFR